MGGLKLLYRLRARLKRRPQLQLDVKETDRGFAIEKVRCATPSHAVPISGQTLYLAEWGTEQA